MMKRYIVFFIFILLVSPGLVHGKEVKFAIINASGANIREKPTTKAPIITVARYGEKFEVVEDLGPWLKIKLPDGRIGFVWTPLTRIEVQKIIEKIVEVKKTPRPEPKPVIVPEKKKKEVKPIMEKPLPPTAEGKLRYGKKLYYKEKYKEAISVLEKAIADASVLENEGKRRQISADAYFLIGLSYVELKKEDRAKEAFKKTLKLVPDYSLNVTYEEYGRKVMNLWKQAEEELEQEEIKKRLKK